MRKAILPSILAAAAAAILAQAQEQKTTEEKVAPIRHSFICSDYGAGKVVAASVDGKIQWECAAPGCQDVWLLPNGNYLFSHLRGVKEVTSDREKKVVWEYKAPPGVEIHTCQPLADGSVLICECGTSRLIEVDREGKIRKEISIATRAKGAHGQFRIARKLANGNYLVAFTGENLVREFDSRGRVLRSIPVPGNPYMALRLPNGNTLIACGDGHKVIEVDDKDTVVWKIEENDLPGNPLRFVAGLQRLPNGNTVVCNWGGHGHVGRQPQMFEVTPDKKVVWQFEDNKQFKTISHVQILDVKGDATKGEILR